MVSGFDVNKRRRAFGKWLRVRRQEEGYGLKPLAARIGCSPAYLSLTERGLSRCVPSMGILVQIAKALGEPIDEGCRRSGRLPRRVEKKLEKIRADFFGACDDA